MGQNHDDSQDQMLINFLSQNALAIKQHPGAVQFQVSKTMLHTLKKKFNGMPGVFHINQQNKGANSTAIMTPP